MTHTEILVCPHCATSLRSEKTFGVADNKTVTCKKCDLKSTLGEWRLHAPDEMTDVESVIPNVRVAAPVTPFQSGHVIVNVQSPQYVHVAKNRMTAILLALLLGGLGAHHFYCGRPLIGVLYIVFVCTFIPAAL